MTLSFPPPKNWQDFEMLTKDMAQYKLAGDFQNYGRPGQAQGGIDILGWDGNSKRTGIQCKHKGNAKAGSEEIVTDITAKVIDKEIAQADTHHRDLEVLIIATTSFRDTKIHDHIDNLNRTRKGKPLSNIILWTWETFDEEINRHSILQYVYYEKILRTFNQYNKDVHILLLLKHALDRPAFATEFHSENNISDFLKAIIDTQAAFSTGRLNDRSGRPISSSYPSKDLTSPEDRKHAEEIKGLLQEIRDFVTDQTKKGNIRQEASFLEFRYDSGIKISDFLNRARARVITLLNSMLLGNKLEPIQSNLLKKYAA